MTHLGCNIDPRVTGTIGGGGRLVALPNFDLRPYLSDAKASGKVCLDLARESFPEKDWKRNTAKHIRDYVAGNDGLIDYLEVGNEWEHGPPWDDVQSDSSWSLPAEDVNFLLRCVAEANPSCPVILGGAVSGHPERLRDIDLDLVDFIGVHPYGQRPHPKANKWEDLAGNHGYVNDLFDAYAAYGKGLAATEFSALGLSEDRQAEYLGLMIDLFRRRGDVECAYWFCARDDMVDGYGLYTAEGRPKQAANVYHDKVREEIPPPLPPAEIKQDDTGMTLNYHLAQEIALNAPLELAQRVERGERFVFNPNGAIGKAWLRNKNLGTPCTQEVPFDDPAEPKAKMCQVFSTGRIVLWMGGEEVLIK